MKTLRGNRIIDNEEVIYKKIVCDAQTECQAIKNEVVGTVWQKAKKRESVVLTPDTEELVAELNPTPFENMVFEYFQQARTHKSPCSAVEYFRQSKYLESSDVSLVLMCFAALLDVPGRAQEMGAGDFDITPILADNPNRFSGNVTVMDFVSCQKLSHVTVASADEVIASRADQKVEANAHRPDLHK